MKNILDVLVVSFLFSLLISSHVQSAEWTGLGSDGNWSTTDNWDASLNNGDPLSFDGGLSKSRTPYYDSNSNDIVNFTASSISFSGYHFNLGSSAKPGNGIKLNGNITGSVGGSNTIYLDIELLGTTTIDVSGTDVIRTFTMYNNAITGSGGIIKIGDGNLTIRSTSGNTFSGGITVESGTLATAGGRNDTTHFGTGTLTINGGNVNLQGASTTVKSLAGTGGSITNAGDFARTFTVDATNSTPTIYTGIIENGTGTILFTKTGSGALILSGANTYTGATAVNGGKLLINGSLGNTIVTVGAGGTLGGTGMINGNTIVNGTLSPGNSPGTLSFGGDLTLNNTSIYAFEAGDLTEVGGTLNLNNDWTVSLQGDGFKAGGSVVLFTYKTLGAFDSTPNIDLTNLIGLSIDPGTLSLTNTNGSIILNGISVIPEPSIISLLGLIFCGMFIFRRRL